MRTRHKRIWLPPARDVIVKFGIDDVSGVRRLSSRLGVSENRIYNWMYAKEDGGAGGFIPLDHHRAILQFARELGIPLTPAELTGLTEFDPPVNSPRRPNRRRLAMAGPELPFQVAK